MIFPQASVTAGSTFFVQTDSYGSGFKAASWDEAMTRAAEYMTEAYHKGDGPWTRRIIYTVYLVPDGWSTGGTILDTLDRCESQDAIHIVEGEA